MQNNSKKEWENKFNEIYTSILKMTKTQKEFETITLRNEQTLAQFKQQFTLDSNSIEFLPAYFNFIEIYLLQADKTTEAERYLKVGMINLLNAGKKDEKSSYQQEDDVLELSADEKNKKLLQSRLDLLFGRYNILNRKKKALDSLTNSIIIYSEIYGPESVGLTPQYYFLAEYFIDFGDEALGNDYKKSYEKNNINSELPKKVIVKNIYLKIADIWRMFFNEQINPSFDINEDEDLIYAIGENYIRLIINRIGTHFGSSEQELALKFRMIKAAICKRSSTSSTAEHSIQEVKDFKANLTDPIIDKEFVVDLERELGILN